ncbi:MAG: PHP domain-containing protein [Cyclobacteriaceae bacterium]
MQSERLGMPAIAITDYWQYVWCIQICKRSIERIRSKPIVGCEFFVSEERKKLKFTKDNPDKSYNQVLLAKNKNGYHNLSKAKFAWIH